jgi:hypothetical protein
MEDGNDKIEALRARQRATQEAQDERKVVVFGNRPEGHPAPVYVAPEKLPPEQVQMPTDKPPVKRIERDFDAIETLTQCLKEAEAGHVQGVIVLMGRATTDDHELVTDVVTQMSFTAAENIQIFAGGLRTAEHDLFALHDDIALEDDDED